MFTNVGLTSERMRMVTYFQISMVFWIGVLCQLLNVYEVNNVRQTEIYTAEPLLTDPSSFEVEYLRWYDLPGTDLILALFDY